MNVEIEKIVKHLVEVGLENTTPNTCEAGLAKGVRLAFAYCMKNGYLTDEFYYKVGILESVSDN